MESNGQSDRGNATPQIVTIGKACSEVAALLGNSTSQKEGEQNTREREWHREHTAEARRSLSADSACDMQAVRSTISRRPHPSRLPW